VKVSKRRRHLIDIFVTFSARFESSQTPFRVTRALLYATSEILDGLDEAGGGGGGGCYPVVRKRHDERGKTALRRRKRKRSEGQANR